MNKPDFEKRAVTHANKKHGNDYDRMGAQTWAEWCLCKEDFIAGANHGYEKAMEERNKIESTKNALMKEVSELKAFISVTLHKDGFSYDEDAVKAMRLTSGIPWEPPKI